MKKSLIAAAVLVVTAVAAYAADCCLQNLECCKVKAACCDSAKK